MIQQSAAKFLEPRKYNSTRRREKSPATGDPFFPLYFSLPAATFQKNFKLNPRFLCRRNLGRDSAPVSPSLQSSRVYLKINLLNQYPSLFVYKTPHDGIVTEATRSIQGHRRENNRSSHCLCLQRKRSP